MREAGWVEAACKVKGLQADTHGSSVRTRLQVEACRWGEGSPGGEDIGPAGGGKVLQEGQE